MQNKKILFNFCLGFLFIFAAMMCARAKTASTSFQVTANVVSDCQATAENLVFGDYDPMKTAISDQSIIVVTCTNGTGYDIRLSEGNSKNFKTRFMKAGDSGNPSQLSYNLYTDAAHKNIWGDGKSDTAVDHGTGNGEKQTYSVYGEIPATQMSVKSDVNYSDNINVSIDYN